MNSIVIRAERLAWFMQRPCLYPELLRRLIRKIHNPILREETPLDATRWCEQRATSAPEVLARIMGQNPVKPIREMYPEIFQNVLQALRTCPAPFTSGAGDLDILYWLCEYLSAVKVIETGVAVGWSSLAILLSINNRNGQLISTDMPYLVNGISTDRYVGLAVPQAYRAGWKLIRCADREALPVAFRKLGQVDLCHYDSAKSYLERMWGYPRLWEQLRSRGIFISDDIGDNSAFAVFADRLGITPYVVQTRADIFADATTIKYVGILVKP